RLEADPQPVSHHQMELNTPDTQDHARNQVMPVPALETMVDVRVAKTLQEALQSPRKCT
ncbi:hypothetical protein Tco_1436477, partial [Tanacetum coccineum]